MPSPDEIQAMMMQMQGGAMAPPTGVNGDGAAAIRDGMAPQRPPIPVSPEEFDMVMQQVEGLMKENQMLAAKVMEYEALIGQVLGGAQGGGMPAGPAMGGPPMPPQGGMPPPQGMPY